MSGSDRDSRPKRPSNDAVSDDPWAKWRQPEAPAAPRGAAPAKPATRETRAVPTVDSEKRPKTKPAPRAAPVSAELPVEEPVKPEGTLGVRKSAMTTDRPVNRRPIRGGAVAKRQTAPAKASPVVAEPAPARPTPVTKAPVERVGPPPEGTRLSKVMSERGMCSRREADLWIERGWVFVDGERVSELGTRVDPRADISNPKKGKHDQAKQVTVLLNKPIGYVSGQPEPGFTPAITLVTLENQLIQSGDPEFKPWMLRNLAPSGRLDIDSTGLLVLTQDGRVAKKLIGDDSQVEKEYLVRVAGEMIKGGLDLLSHGLELDGQALKPARVKQLNEDQLHFILKEGKKRQIRRMCELVGLRVIGLKRVRIGRVKLGDLEIGQWRFLRADEAF